LSVTEKGRFGLELSPHREAPSQYCHAAVPTAAAAATLRIGKNTEYMYVIMRYGVLCYTRVTYETGNLHEILSLKCG